MCGHLLRFMSFLRFINHLLHCISKKNICFCESHPPLIYLLSRLNKFVDFYVCVSIQPSNFMYSISCSIIAVCCSLNNQFQFQSHMYLFSTTAHDNEERELFVARGCYFVRCLSIILDLHPPPSGIYQTA